MPAATSRARRSNWERGGADQLPRHVEFQLCQLIDRPFDDDEWIFEPKLDGVRVMARYDGRKLELTSRNDKSQNRFFPEIAGALQRALKGPAVLDGEIVCLDEHGVSRFHLIQQRFHVEDPAERDRRMKRFPAVIYIFDAMYAGGRDLRARPLVDRKDELHRAMKWTDTVREVPWHRGNGTQLLAEMCRQHAEGIIGKLAQGPYQAGRGAEWVKIKCGYQQEFVIGGFTDPQRSRVGLGALLMGYYDADGKSLRYAGKVGTGYDNKTLLELRKSLGKLETDTSPFADQNVPKTGGRWSKGRDAGAVHWVKPIVVAEVAFSEWTEDGSLRHPRFQGLRTDKEAKDVRRERAEDAAMAKSEGERETSTQRTASAAKSTPKKRPRSAGKRATAKRGAPERSGKLLNRYAEKRDFTRTPEPSGKQGRREPKGKGLKFVIQEHAASHLHWDFRLEAEGVLKSWAVPKVPTMDPGIKRLAVEVEDHPLDYGSFEGDIPSGSYGAGHVDIWDKGTYFRLRGHQPVEGDIAEDMRRGKVEVELHGKKLRGGFALVRMGGSRAGRGGKPQWLLMKMKDEYAREESEEDRERHEEELAQKKERAKEQRARRRVRGGPKSEDWGGAKPGKGGSGGAKDAVQGELSEPSDPPDVDDLKFTHLDKIMFPEAGFTKGDLIDYYRKAAKALIPLIKDRPASLERLPDGVGGVRFWQKNTPRQYPDWIARATIPTLDGRKVAYVLISNVQTLLYLINQGVITIHTGFSRVQSLDRPDFVMFDLDPSGASFQDVVKVAKLLRPLIQKRGSDGEVSTSGKNGLHVNVPWTGGGGFDEARDWARQIARELVEQHPDLATLERSKSKRQNRVYIDVEQNALGKHAVPSWTVRATPAAGVATPLSWDELTDRLDPRDFDIKTVVKRLSKGARPAGKDKKAVPGRGAAARVGRRRGSGSSSAAGVRSLATRARSRR